MSRVRAIVEVELDVPDAKANMVTHKGETFPYGVDSETHDLVGNLIHGCFEHGDPDDELNLTVVVTSDLKMKDSEGRYR